MTNYHIRFCLLNLLASCLLAGCWAETQNELVVYSALDSEFSKPILATFEAETGIRVLAKYDTESTKTVGLANAIIAESNRPRCDVFWNNEILNTLRLADRGLLRPYSSPRSELFPTSFRALDGTWSGFAARARILLVNTDRLPDQAEWPKSVTELADARWHKNVGIAKPLFGTTATHATVLVHQWGSEKSRNFFRSVHEHASVLSGNKQVAQAVARGTLAWGLTDTDDAIIEIERGMPVVIVYPDQVDDGLGTLFIPNTVSIIRGTAQPELAQRLIDYLLSAEVELRLAECASAQIPLASDVTVETRVKTPQDIRAMQVDFAAAATSWEECAAMLVEIFMRN